MQPVRPLGHGTMVIVSPSSCFISAGIATPISGLKCTILLNHEVKIQRRISTCHIQRHHLGGSGFDWDRPPDMVITPYGRSDFGRTLPVTTDTNRPILAIRDAQLYVISRLLMNDQGCDNE